jgi:hypothetical protein
LALAKPYDPKPRKPKPEAEQHKAGEPS